MSIECEVLEYEVSVDAVGQRADKFLSSVCSEFSRSRLQGLIADGHVLLNNAPFKTASFKVDEGDVFCVRVPEPEPSVPEAEDLPLDIVYEDDDLVVVNKAVGMVVHPGAGNWNGTLVNALLHHCGDSLSGIGGVLRPGIVHRLDKDTSGLMIAAKNDHAHHHLSDQLAERSLTRIYHALVVDVPLPIKGTIDRPIGRHRHNRLKMSVMTNSPKDACTHYKVLEDFNGGFSLVECKLETGRTHQIRVHLEVSGHPLVGDVLYPVQQTKIKSMIKNSGYPAELAEEMIGLGRQMLHAQTISFIHPRSEEVMSFSSDLPGDFSKLLKMLRK